MPRARPTLQDRCPCRTLCTCRLLSHSQHCTGSLAQRPWQALTMSFPDKPRTWSAQRTHMSLSHTLRTRPRWLRVPKSACLCRTACTLQHLSRACTFRRRTQRTLSLSRPCTQHCTHIRCFPWPTSRNWQGSAGRLLRTSHLRRSKRSLSRRASMRSCPRPPCRSQPGTPHTFPHRGRCSQRCTCSLRLRCCRLETASWPGRPDRRLLLRLQTLLKRCPPRSRRRCCSRPLPSLSKTCLRRSSDTHQSTGPGP